ncbi:MAG: hypothetical protein HLUCCA04_05390 [Oceanicaulis sp. HLUCCA04]|nr:MAG: hypothetical protein HLUCCA04_05390 [Oceanicaulis sp. HLUCCA04]
MWGRHVTSTPLIEQYLRDLSRGLGSLSARERDDIIMETRSHLSDRCASVGEAEAIRRIGPASVLAGDYLAAETRQPAHTATADNAGLTPLSFMSLVTGSCVLWACAVVLASLCLAELAQPALVSIWLNSGTGNVFVGAANPDVMARLTDLAGAWFLPVAACLAALAGMSALMMMRFVWRHASSARREALHYSALSPR